MKIWRSGALLFATVMVAGCGAQAAAPAVTVTTSVTATVEAPTTVPTTTTVRQTVTQTVVPQSCLDSIADARKLANETADNVRVYADILQATPDGIYAAARGDAAGVEKLTGIVRDATDKINASTERIKKIPFATDAAACEAASK